jgi:glucose-1-phosphate adenylyltransferase
VIDFVEKPQNPPPMPGQPDRALASMGVYIFNAKFLFEQLERDALTKAPAATSARTSFPTSCRATASSPTAFADSCVGSDHHKPYWRDVGTIDAYWEANMEMTKVTPELNLYDKDWPIWTYQEQMPPAKFVFDDDDRRGTAVDSLFPAAASFPAPR